MKAAVTGHRPQKLGYEWDHVGPYSYHIARQLEVYARVYGVDEGYSGMALGADFIWAKLLIQLGIPLHCYLPFKGQECKWPPSSQKAYFKMLSLATDIYIVDIDKHCTFDEFLKLPNGKYHPSKMQDRNIAMVDIVDILFEVFDGSSGGTANCIKYAQSIGKREVLINPNPNNH